MNAVARSTSFNLIAADPADGYTPGTIIKAIKQVLNPRRIHHLPNKPLHAVEMVAPLAQLEPVSIEEEAEFAQWYGA